MRCVDLFRSRCCSNDVNGRLFSFSFFRATSGDKRNNNKFSPCSLQQINSVLNSKARDVKGCFTAPQAAICGNGVVEKGEECDCGWEEDCEEACCFPMKSSPGKGETPCTLRPNKICSPSQVGAVLAVVVVVFTVIILLFNYCNITSLQVVKGISLVNKLPGFFLPSRIPARSESAH